MEGARRIGGALAGLAWLCTTWLCTTCLGTAPARKSDHKRA